MEKRLNRKIDVAFQDFKLSIKNKMTELNIVNAPEGRELLQYIYDFPVFSIVKLDLQKRKRVKNSVPFNERCCALRANNEQCTRRKKNDDRFCGTHIKGIPHGEISADSQIKDTVKKVEVWAQDIQGIIYFIDSVGNVYDPQQVHENEKNPSIIAKYTKTEDGEFKIPSIF
uniref:Uncharacterized protein n=1 Tax=viral metagenome TaxID=1070528 RepID=A0A6C0C4D6_9ZZZZ